MTPYGESKVLAERSSPGSPTTTSARPTCATPPPTAPRRGCAPTSSSTTSTGVGVHPGEVRLQSDGTPWRPLVHVERHRRAPSSPCSRRRASWSTTRRSTSAATRTSCRSGEIADMVAEALRRAGHLRRGRGPRQARLPGRLRQAAGDVPRAPAPDDRRRRDPGAGRRLRRPRSDRGGVLLVAVHPAQADPRTAGRRRDRRAPPAPAGGRRRRGGRVNAPACRLCGAELTRTFVDLGMSPLCESYLRRRAARRARGLLPAARPHLRRVPARAAARLRAAARISSPTTPTSPRTPTRWVAHAKRYADDDDRAARPDAGQPGHRGGQQRRLPAAALRRRGHPGARRRAGRERRRGGREPGASGPRSQFLGARDRRARSPAARPGRPGRRRTTSSPTCPTSVDFARGPARAGQGRRARSRWSSRTCSGSSSGRQYDTIYHEHYSYLSLLTASRALATAGLRVVDVEELSTHGGSLRVLRRSRTSAAGEPSRARSRRCSPPRTPPACTRSRGTTGSPTRCSTIKQRPARVPARRAAARASRWPGTAPRARATRCSTTAASGPTCSRTRSTAARTSRACSCPARTSRSTRPSGSRETGPTTSWSCRGTCGRRSAEQLALRPRVGRQLVCPDPALEIVV